MGELKISMYICIEHCYASQASFIYLAVCRNKSNTHNYSSDNSEIVADDRAIPAQARPAYLLVMVTG